MMEIQRELTERALLFANNPGLAFMFSVLRVILLVLPAATLVAEQPNTFVLLLIIVRITFDICISLWLDDALGLGINLL